MPDANVVKPKFVFLGSYHSWTSELCYKWRLENGSVPTGFLYNTDPFRVLPEGSTIQCTARNFWSGINHFVPGVTDTVDHQAVRHP